MKRQLRLTLVFFLLSESFLLATKPLFKEGESYKIKNTLMRFSLCLSQASISGELEMDAKDAVGTDWKFEGTSDYAKIINLKSGQCLTYIPKEYYCWLYKPARAVVRDCKESEYIYWRIIEGDGTERPLIITPASKNTFFLDGVELKGCRPKFPYWQLERSSN